jgi:hypothetical protein
LRPSTSPARRRPRHRHELLVAHQAVEQLGVVHDLVVATDLRVLVLDRVEAVRAGDDDLGRAELPEGLDVLLASIWKSISLPARRAESPVQVSPSPSTANDTPAVSSSSATARVVFFARSS